ncbi:hypothetical protein GCM10027404_12820 [Arthrobacter tumbae]
MNALNVPARVPPPGLAPRARVTGTPDCATAVPVDVRRLTLTGGAITVSAVVLDGATAKASLLAVATVTVPLGALPAVQDRKTAVTM